jgi:hypothetical protein
MRRIRAPFVALAAALFALALVLGLTQLGVGFDADESLALVKYIRIDDLDGE